LHKRSFEEYPVKISTLKYAPPWTYIDQNPGLDRSQQLAEGQNFHSGCATADEGESDRLQ
jgi:hypothetical protein